MPKGNFGTGMSSAMGGMAMPSMGPSQNFNPYQKWLTGERQMNGQINNTQPYLQGPSTQQPMLQPSFDVTDLIRKLMGGNGGYSGGINFGGGNIMQPQ